MNKIKQTIKKIPSKVSLFIKDVIFDVIRMINTVLPCQYDVIIVRMDHLGDMVMWYDCARAIREFYKDKKIALLTHHGLASFAQMSDYFDRVIETDKKSLLKLVGLKSKILIVPAIGINRGFPKAICAKERYATENIFADKHERRYERFFNHIVKMPQKTTSDWITNEIFCRAIVGNDYEIKLADLSLIIKPSEKYLNYFAVSLGSQWVRKNWPAERFAEVAQRVYDTYHIPCCLIGTASDRPLADKFLQVYHGEYVDLIGKTSLQELFTVLSEIRFIVCNDTGNMHAAIACRTKCFCIASGRFYPRFTVYPDKLMENSVMRPVFIGADFDCWGCYSNLVHAPVRIGCETPATENQLFECVAAVTVEQVWNAVDSWLTDNQE